MKIDLYTKTILTIIAICLIVICSREIPIISPGSAESNSSMEVVITGVKIPRYPKTDPKTDPNSNDKFVDSLPICRKLEDSSSNINQTIPIC